MQTLPDVPCKEAADTPYARALVMAQEQLQLEHPTWDFSRLEYQAAMTRLVLAHPELRPRLLHAAMVTVLQQSNVPQLWIDATPEPNFPPLPKVTNVNDQVNERQMEGFHCATSEPGATEKPDSKRSGADTSRKRNKTEQQIIVIARLMLLRRTSFLRGLRILCVHFLS